MKVRKANIKDLNIFFNWRNDPSTKKNYINNQKISYVKHFVWFLKKINSPNTHIYIAESRKIPVGQFRLEKNNDFWELSYSIDKNYRGKGFGKMLIEKCIQLFPNLKLMALVMKNNKASLAILKKNKFKEFDENSGTIKLQYERK